MIKVRQSILVPWESFWYLRMEMHRQRSARPNASVSNKFRNNEHKMFHNFCNKDGYKTVMDFAFGGCNGSPINAYAEGRWTSWSVKEMTQMLDAVGLPWKEGSSVEVIEL